MKVLLLLTVLSNVSLASDCVDCTLQVKPFDSLVKNVESLQAPAVVNCEDTLMKNASEEYLELFGNLPKEEKNIKGLRLEGSREELQYLQKMLGEKPLDTWSQAKDCKNVLCALTKMYGSEEAAQRVLNIAKRDGYIVSASKEFEFDNKSIGQMFTPAEVRDIDLSYKLLPASYKKLSSLDRLKRLPKGLSSPRAPNAAAFASPGLHSSFFNKDGEIVFLDGAFSADKSWGPSTAVHELSHHIDYSSSKKIVLGISEDKEYLNLSGWKKTNKYVTNSSTGKRTLEEQWEHTPGKKFITDYAATQPAEDFAESAAYYVFKPNTLKLIDPKKYEFIKKNIFKGKEYTSQMESPLPTNELLQVCLGAKKDYQIYGDSSYSSSSFLDNCLREYMKNFKITDPKLCSYNIDQIQNQLMDTISTPVRGLNDFVNQCASDLPVFSMECFQENNFKKNCAIKKYFSKNSLSAEKLGMSESETKKIEDALGQKILFVQQGTRGESIMSSIISKQGKSNIISKMLIDGLSNKDRISDQYSLTIQKYFIDSAVAGLLSSLDKKGYKFDSSADFAAIAHYDIMLNNDMSANLGSFQNTVLKNASKSKDKNLELVKEWAKTQSLADSSLFEDLAESLTKYGK